MALSLAARKHLLSTPRVVSRTGSALYAALLSRISRQTVKQSAQTFAGPVTSDLESLPRLRQKLQRCRVAALTVVNLESSMAVDFTARSAAPTQESQIYTFGPEINLDTSLGGRSHQVQTASAEVRRRQTCHQLPPAAVTICCTL